MNNRIKIGLLTGGYFEYWRMYPGLDKTVEQEMKQLADGLNQKVDVVWSGLADTLEKTEEAGKRFQQENIDLLVICEGTYFPDYMPVQTMEYIRQVPILVLLTQPHNHVPLDLNYQDAIHHSFGLVGLVQLTGAFRKMGQPFEIIVSALDDPSIYDKVAEYARAVSAVKQMRYANIGIVGHTFQGMYDLELDKTKLKSAIGPNVFYIELAELISLWREVPDPETSQVAEEVSSQYSLEGTGKQDVKNACQLGLAMERLAQKYNLSGLCHLCQHLIHVETGTTPCYAATRLEDKGVMVTCEGDIGNLTCMCLIYFLTGEIPSFLEWGMYDARENAMLLVHHGAGNPRLAKGPKDVRITPTGEKWGFQGQGASFRYMGKPGRVTIASLINDRDGWKMLLTGGEALDVPCRPFYGQQFMVQVKQPINEYLESLCREGVTHHAILAYGDLTQQLQRAAKLMNIRYVEV